MIPLFVLYYVFHTPYKNKQKCISTPGKITVYYADDSNIFFRHKCIDTI